MKIKQFKDAPLAHYSYAVVSQGKMAVVDPGRDPFPYYEYAEEMSARIVAVFETHPHADFVSGHLQIHQETGADILVSKDLGADYEHLAFDEGDRFEMGGVVFQALNTPGHSPDSICVAATEGREVVLFTGDTLFIGDVGRPDLRENAGKLTAERRSLAASMFKTIHTKFNDFPDEALVYPAHGAGSLCGKNMSSDSSSTLGQERKFNWAFNEENEDHFIETILSGQPFVPAYFGFNVDLNKTGADNVRETKARVPLYIGNFKNSEHSLLVDVRDESDFKKGHLENSINIMCRNDNDKFETWLGSVVKPGEVFSLVVGKMVEIDQVLTRISKIGYENQLKCVQLYQNEDLVKDQALDLHRFKESPGDFTIIDVRNEGEVQERKIFSSAVNLPLHELRDRLEEIATAKPIVVHCAAGYRSAVGSSILSSHFPALEVFDLGEKIRTF